VAPPMDTERVMSFSRLAGEALGMLVKELMTIRNIRNPKFSDRKCEQFQRKCSIQRSLPPKKAPVHPIQVPTATPRNGSSAPSVMIVNN
jgi:hypothetical protein